MLSKRMKSRTRQIRKNSFFLIFQYQLCLLRRTCNTERFFYITWTNKLHYFLLIYFNNKPLHASSRLAAHHQEDQLCINSNWCSHALCWLAAGCSKHVETYYWNKLIENSASPWFMLYRYITIHGQQNNKKGTTCVIWTL